MAATSLQLPDIAGEQPQGSPLLDYCKIEIMRDEASLMTKVLGHISALDDKPLSEAKTSLEQVIRDALDPNESAEAKERAPRLLSTSRIQLVLDGNAELVKGDDDGNARFHLLGEIPAALRLEYKPGASERPIEGSSYFSENLADILRGKVLETMKRSGQISCKADARDLLYDGVVASDEDDDDDEDDDGGGGGGGGLGGGGGGGGGGGSNNADDAPSFEVPARHPGHQDFHVDVMAAVLEALTNREALVSRNGMLVLHPVTRAALPTIDVSESMDKAEQKMQEWQAKKVKAPE